MPLRAQRVHGHPQRSIASLVHLVGLLVIAVPLVAALGAVPVGLIAGTVPLGALVSAVLAGYALVGV